jgi:hypothetical protein
MVASTVYQKCMNNNSLPFVGKQTVNQKRIVVEDDEKSGAQWSASHLLQHWPE